MNLTSACATRLLTIFATGLLATAFTPQAQAGLFDGDFFSGAPKQKPAPAAPANNGVSPNCPAGPQNPDGQAPRRFPSPDPEHLITDGCDHLICRTLKPVAATQADGTIVMRYPIPSQEALYCFPEKMSHQWHVTKTAWSDDDEQGWQQYIHNFGMAAETGDCKTFDACMVSQKANSLFDKGDLDVPHYSDCAKLPEVLRQYFSFKSNLPFSYVSSSYPVSSRDLLIKSDANGMIVTDRFHHPKETDARYTNLGNFPTLRHDYVGGGRDFRTQAIDIMETSSRNYRNYGDVNAEFDNILPTNKIFPLPPEQYNVVFDCEVRVSPFATLKAPVKAPVAFGMDWLTPNHEGECIVPPAQEQADFLQLAADHIVRSAIPDFYSPKIDPSGIKIGTVVYDPNGHVAMVYDIRAGGKIMLVAASPGNYVSTTVFKGTEFVRSKPLQGAGFKNWRPWTIVNPQFKGAELVGGGFKFAVDSDIADVNYEQYFGDSWAKGLWDDARSVMPAESRRAGEGLNTEWDRFVKMRMAGAGFVDDPVSDLKSGLSEVCNDLQMRGTAIDGGRAFALQPHMDHLPSNIYGADGDWENQATPGKDFKIRKNILLLSTLFQSAASDATIKAKMADVLAQANKSCPLQYTNSKQNPVVITTLEDAFARAPYMSFDMYDCPERRWGATSAEELASCTNTATENSWYRNEQFLRNQAESFDVHPENMVMGWSLDDLKTQASQQDNKAHPEKYDIFKIFSKLN